MPPLNPEGLRACQIEAVNGVERSLAQNHPRALVQMATGAGKTFTAARCPTGCSRTPASAASSFSPTAPISCARRAMNISPIRPPGTGRSFAELYNVQKLGAAGLDPGAQVVVATIQRVYSALTGEALSEDEEEVSSFERDSADGEQIVAYNPLFPIESFDLVVTDECHRSIYGTWRQVLDYFDAFIRRPHRDALAAYDGLLRPQPCRAISL